MELRKYQNDLINHIRNEIIKEKRTICAVLVCHTKKERSVVYRAPEGTVSAD